MVAPAGHAGGCRFWPRTSGPMPIVLYDRTGFCKVVEKNSLRLYSVQQMVKQLSVSEAAAELGVTRGRVHELIRDKRLAATKVGKQYVINAAALGKLKIGKPGRPKGK